jgi:hypothetical protein
MKKRESNVIVFNHGNDDKEMLPLTAFILRNKNDEKLATVNV